MTHAYPPSRVPPLLELLQPRLLLATLVTINDPAINEGDAGATPLTTFAASLSAGSASPIVLSRVLGLCGCSWRMIRCISPQAALRRRFSSEGVVPVRSSWTGRAART